MSFFKERDRKIEENKNIEKQTISLYLKNFCKPKSIAFCGMFIAMYIVIKHFNIQMGDIFRISFDYLAIAGAGLTGGPLMGVTVGILGDITGTILSPPKNGAPFNFGFTLNYALLGLTYGILFYRKNIILLRVLIAGIIQFLISLFLTPIWLHIMYGTPYETFLISRLPSVFIITPFNIIILYIIIKPLSAAYKKYIKSKVL